MDGRDKPGHDGFGAAARVKLTTKFTKEDPNLPATSLAVSPYEARRNFVPFVSFVVE